MLLLTRLSAFSVEQCITRSIVQNLFILPPNIDVKFVIGANAISFSPSLLWDFVSMFDLIILFSYAVHMLSVNEPVNKINFISLLYSIKIKIDTICKNCKRVHNCILKIALIFILMEQNNNIRLILYIQFIYIIR